MNCSKCGNESFLKVGIGKDFNVCGVCAKLHRLMTESLRLEYVEKLKDAEEFFFNGGKDENTGTVVVSDFVDDEEMYEERKTEPQIVPLPEDEDELPQELFG